jgi:hypothetical protein
MFFRGASMHIFLITSRHFFGGLFALSLLLLTACHEDGATASMPDIKIEFPPPVSSTDADSIIVRGTGTGSVINMLYVNGVRAKSSDGYATWSAKLNLEPGENPLTVVAHEGKWNRGHIVATAVITREDFADVGSGIDMLFPLSMAEDYANNRVLIADVGLAALLEISLETGNRAVIADLDIGIGPDFIEPIAVALDSANNRALVLDDGLLALLAVDLTTGNRSVISDVDIGEGPDFVALESFTLDLTNNRALVMDSDLSAMLAVNLDNGDRSIVSESATGDGPAFTLSTSVVLDAANDRALVGDFENLLAVDLVSGDRVVIANIDTGSGPFNIPLSIALDDVNDRVLVADYDFFDSRLLEVKIANGDRGLISSNFSSGKGPCLCLLSSIALVGSKDVVLAADVGHPAMFAIDLVNGQRVIWSQ